MPWFGLLGQWRAVFGLDDAGIAVIKARSAPFTACWAENSHSGRDHQALAGEGLAVGDDDFAARGLPATLTITLVFGSAPPLPKSTVLNGSRIVRRHLADLIAGRKFSTTQSSEPL